MVKRYIVRYTHVVEMVYEDVVEAGSEEEARQIVEDGDMSFDEVIDESGLEVKDIEVIGEVGS